MRRQLGVKNEILTQRKCYDGWIFRQLHCSGRNPQKIYAFVEKGAWGQQNLVLTINVSPQIFNPSSINQYLHGTLLTTVIVIGGIYFVLDGITKGMPPKSSSLPTTVVTADVGSEYEFIPPSSVPKYMWVAAMKKTYSSELNNERHNKQWRRNGGGQGVHVTCGKKCAGDKQCNCPPWKICALLQKLRRFDGICLKFVNFVFLKAPSAPFELVLWNFYVKWGAQAYKLLLLCLTYTNLTLDLSFLHYVKKCCPPWPQSRSDATDNKFNLQQTVAAATTRRMLLMIIVQISTARALTHLIIVLSSTLPHIPPCKNQLELHSVHKKKYSQLEFELICSFPLMCITHALA